MGRLLADVTPLRASRDYRLLYIGQGVSEVGRQVTVVALAVQVYELTDSTLMVGLMSLVQVVPLIVGALTGGTLADAVDRRRLLIVLNLALGVLVSLLVVNALQAQPRVWVLFTLAAVMALFHGGDSPTRKATVSRLVSEDVLPAAYALIQVVRELARVIGPAIGGLVIAQFGFAFAYAIDALTFVWAVALLLPMRPVLPEEGASKASFGALVDGVRFLAGRRLLLANFAVDLNAMVFAMPRALFPAIGTDLLGGTAATVGYLYAAPGVGALIGAGTSGWVGRVRRQGRAVILAVAVWSVAVALIGVAPNLWFILGALAFAGAADVVSSVFRTTILQLTVPDGVRGRLSAVHTSVVTAGPRIGEAQAGALATLTGVRVAVLAGGLTSLLGLVAIVRWAPRYWHFEVRPDGVDGSDDGSVGGGAPQEAAAVVQRGPGQGHSS